MAKREVKTDLWVAGQLDKCGIQYTPQGSDVKEISDALSSASKRGTGKAGFPEYVAVVNDFVIVIEDKADLAQHIKLTDSGIIDTATKAVTDFAVNGAYFYAKHIAQNSSFRKVFAIGVSGDYLKVALLRYLFYYLRSNILSEGSENLSLLCILQEIMNSDRINK